MSNTPKKVLSLFDSTCLIVGIIIGVGIYQTAPDVAKGALSGWGVLAIWYVGGLISLCGAMNYAELATAYPQEGGDYVYLTRAYGRGAGFLFGWGQLLIIRPGDIAVMAFAFATYAQKIFDPLPSYPTQSLQLYAISSVAILTVINMVGVQQGKWTQNALTVVKAVGLLAIVGVAFMAPMKEKVVAVVPDDFPLSLALILVLFTFGGWNEMAYVAAEVKNPRKNIVRALVIGTLAVTVLYLLMNGAFLYAIGYQGLATSGAVANDTIATVFPSVGGRLISLLICISALGAVNGLIFTGARISYAVGADHRAFRFLGRWNEQTGTPARALALQGLIAAALVVILGSFIDTILYTAAAVYTFYLATSLAVVVLRFKEPNVERPYRVTGYPFTTILFGVACVLLIRGAILYKPLISAVSGGIFLVGVVFYWISTLSKTNDSH